MATIKILGAALVIKSVIPFATLAKINRFEPDALNLRKENKEIIFTVTTGRDGGINKNGVIFTNAAADGSAELTVAIQAGLSTDEKKAYVENYIAPAILKLNALEAQITNAVTGLEEDLASITNAIEFVD